MFCYMNVMAYAAVFPTRSVVGMFQACTLSASVQLGNYRVLICQLVFVDL